ncbi:hypothetical protein ROLI_015680 [Roseobacter fucihabitans]|uniref:DUF6603 domain-containing protein n=1 Tax=Roseobacter fucihabitans TaxID=1537242 RepID=A0ABZ2BSU8_9RHOB|nr:DUF6603 domain-containing protein [Roseobacter litoralis]MBC6965389.1 hypothetical protein [Roseobacter litoralis]
MNAFSADEFGDTADLLRALGLVDAAGEFNSDWLGNPEAYLKTMLADDAQRQALFDFVATLRGGDTERDPEGRLWIELFAEDLGGGSRISFFVIADDTPASEVHLFLGVRFGTGAPLVESQSSLMFPLFRAGKTGPAPDTPELIGNRGGVIALTSDVTVSDTPAPPGEAGLQGVGLRLLIPTLATDGAPQIGLTLRGMQLPGQSSGRDVILSLSDPDSLRESGLELIIALLQARVGTAAGAQIAGFAKLIGLGDDPAIPPLPVAEFFERGVEALGDWLAQVLGDAPRRSAWLQALADVFGGAALVQGDEVLITLGASVLRLGLRAEAGASGKPVLTVSCAFGLRDGPAEVALRADLVRLDLGLGTALAVPMLRGEARFDLSGVVMPDVSVETLVIGFGLNADRRPILVVELLNAVLFNTAHPRLDLTNPDALAATASAAITDALAEVLGNLGPGGDLIATVLGWQAPPGATPTYPRIDLLAFLGDPLGRLRTHWEAVLNGPAADVTAGLAALRHLLTGDGSPTAITGTGTAGEPWVLPLVAGLHVALWRDARARLVIGLAFLRQVDSLGQRCTVLETRLRVGIVALDLQSGAAGFLPEITLRGLGRARGGGRLRTDQGDFRLEVDHLGLRALWTPEDGLGVTIEAPKPTVYINGVPVPLDIPDFSGGLAQSIASFTNEQWDAIERLVSLLVHKIGQDWLNDLIEAVGWRRKTPILGAPQRHRLRLADLIADPAEALRGWLARILADADARIEQQIQPLARFLSGRPAARISVTGRGTLRDPWRIALSDAPQMPAIAVWRQPDAPLPVPNAFASLPLRRWRPGRAGLPPGKLARAILTEFPDITGPFGAGLAQEAVSTGLAGLARLWQGSDGRLRPPAVPIPGATVHLIQNQTARAIFTNLDPAQILGVQVATRITVRVQRASAAVDATLNPARVLDLREAGRDPLAFTPLPAQSGEWHVLLAPRDAARLPSGDADGVAGQIARLRHALSLIAAQPDVCVIADAAASHACWLTLDAMGSGIDRLITVGMPVVAQQVPVTLPAVQGEMLRRLAEFLPDLDPAVPDDDDLARARDLIGTYLSVDATLLEDLALPFGWSMETRADLSRHLVHGAFDTDAIARAMSAAVAAGLSLNAQTRNAQRKLQDMTSASLGVWLPLASAPGTTGIRLRGHGLAEIIGIDLEPSAALPETKPRPARVISAALEIAHSGGWLIGGPERAPRPLDLELRSLEIELSLTLGTAGAPKLNRARLVMHGVRIRGRSFPRLVLSPDLAVADLGIDGQAAPSMPEIQDMLGQVFAQMSAAADPSLAKLADAVRAAGILGAGDALDPLSLSNWLDDPAARLRDVLDNPDLRNRLLDWVAQVTGDVTGLSFDPVRQQVTVALSGDTGMPVFTEWAVSSVIGPAGVSSAALRLGAQSDTHLAVPLMPFAASLTLGRSHADALGGLPAVVPLWPAPDVTRLLATSAPALASHAMARLLEGLRASDPGVRPVVDAALNALGMLDSASGTPRVAIPPLMFINPGAWLRLGTVLGTLDGATIRPERAIALMEALKPLVGLSGAPGVWDIAPGLSLRARSAAGLIVEFTLDPALFMPGADVDFGGAIGLHIGSDGRVLPALAVFVGLSGGVAGQRAVHLAVAGGSTRLFLRNGAGSDLEIYPNPAGLGQLATQGVTAALPAALDAIVDTNSPAGDVLGDIGDALLLRVGGNFDGAAMISWVTDPAGTLEARWIALLTSGLVRLGAALPSDITLTVTAAGVRLEIPDAGTSGSTVHVALNASPVSLEVGANITTIPFVRTVSTTLKFDASGLALSQAGVGPADIPLSDGISLRPIFALDVGSEAMDPFVSIGLAVAADNAQALALRYAFNSESFDLGFGSNSPEDIASGIMHFAIDLIGSFLLELEAINDVLDETIGPANSTSIRDLLTGVLLKPGGGLDPDLFRVIMKPGESLEDLLEDKLARVITLIANVADANPTVRVGGELDIGIARTGEVIGFSLGLAGRLPLVEGDIALWLENDSRWIIGGPTAGLKIGLLRESSGALAFEPTLSVDGVGLRIGRSNGPLLESPIAIGSIALHGFARLGDGQKLGGAQVQLSEIAVAVGSASGDEEGGNAVAQGMLAETNDGDAALAPAFSPALSVQTRPSADGGGVAFRFVAGEGEGPWWLPIRSQFGPIYIDQIGLGTQMSEDTLQAISLLFDGNVSIAGLQAAVDDLELRYRLDAGGIFDPASWSVDLAGLAVSADMSGVVLAGGLRKFEIEGTDSIDYIGMLAARFGTYGLSLYGGYSAIKGDDPYSAFFVYGAVLGPFGGVPAFFLTGIGGGFGINRDLIPPTSPGDFDDFIMIAALDPAFSPDGDLNADLAVIRGNFPEKKGKFWFAAGISFTSFALVDGIAVVAVEFGQGFELSIFGLARMALPRPQVALVSIELGLIARFSTEEGVIWIQAQLTDNSWLLHTSARLTGGFAYVSWFKGDKAGQFVITLGGYHPNFHRDGYPVVPRLGFNWSVSSNIVIKAEVYFALTSEAIMAGGLFEASAKFGPAFAHLSFGGNAIVYFDPFNYEADAHARISAGIRISTWFGTIRLSFSLGAYIEVRGPEFHGTARIEIGPIDIHVRFGDSSKPRGALVSWSAFCEKYLELATNDSARAISAIAGRGALPPASSDGEEAGSADGSAAHPYDVTSEFELSFTSTIPLTAILCDGRVVATGAKPNLGVTPSGKAVKVSRLILSLRRTDGGAASLNLPDRIFLSARRTGKFPIGVWGPPQDDDTRKMPKGDVITATEGLDLQFKSVRSRRIPNDASGGVGFDQVEPGQRKPLPLRAAGALRASLLRVAKEQRALLSAMNPDKMPQFASDWHGAARQATAQRSFARARAVPMRIGLLSERIIGTAAAGKKRVKLAPGQSTKTVTFGKARLRGLMVQPVRMARKTAVDAVTSVTMTASIAKNLKRMSPPALVLNPQIAGITPVLLRAQIGAPKSAKTLVAATVVPETVSALSSFSSGRRGAGSADRKTLAGIENMVQPRSANRGETRALMPGEIAVFDLPGAGGTLRFESAGAVALKGVARLIAIGGGGHVIVNNADAGRAVLPAETRAFAVIAGEEPAPGDLAGWLETTQIAYLGYGTARCPGGFVRAEGASRARAGKKAGCGWMQARDLTDQSALVETQFDRGARSVALMIDGALQKEDLETLALHFDGLDMEEGAPQLVPFDGKTLIVYSSEKPASVKPFSLSIGGRTDDRLDGVIAAQISADRLIARLLNAALRLDLETGSGQSSKTTSITWKAPANLRVTQPE